MEEEQEEEEMLVWAILLANARAALWLLLSMHLVWAHRLRRRRHLARSATGGQCGPRSSCPPRARICASHKLLAKIIMTAEQSVENTVLMWSVPLPGTVGTTGPSADYGLG